MIEIPEQEAELFKRFREYQDRFELMLSSDMFEMKRGSATINFDKDGNISSIKTEKYYYPKNVDNRKHSDII